MSDQKQAQGSSAGRSEQVRVRVRKLFRSRQRSMLGIPEIVGLAASALMLLAVIFAYFSFLTPARSRLASLEDERKRLQQTLRESQVNIDTSQNKQSTIEQINQSLVDFENQRLAGRNAGRMALYDELNTLMKRNTLRNTSGPTYTALEPLGSNPTSTSATRPANAKWQSVFPGIGVSVTVEGQYQNLRRFVRDIEASSQFIVINAVELQGVTDVAAPVLSPEGVPVPNARGTVVSLRLDMATYFRRAAPEDAAAASAQEESGTR
ncbi:MAG: GspMb/PilO family protein [Pyrinomonadaceae bacterium]